MLGANTRTAFASGADPRDVAKLTGAIKSYGLEGADNLDKAMNAAYVGGKLGSFELRDQAKWLPAQLSKASGIGYSGVDGMQRVVAMNQVAMRTAGSSDEAGNNVANFLDKLASPDFSRAMANNIKVRKGDPLNAKGQFDWKSYMLEQREQGVMAADAFATVIKRELESDAKYQALKNKQVDPNDKQAMQEKDKAMLKLLENSVVANILTDQQARAGATSMIRYGDDYDGMVRQMSGNSTLERDATWKSQQEHASYQQRVNEQLNIQYQSYKDVNGVLQTFNTGLTDFMRNHETLATSAHQAGTALATIGALTTVGSLLGGGLIRGGGAGALTTVGSRTAGAVGTAGATTTAAAVVGSGVVGAGIGTVINKAFLEGNAQLSDAIGGTIATALASMGNENAQQALDQHFDSLINQNQQTVSK